MARRTKTTPRFREALRIAESDKPRRVIPVIAVVHQGRMLMLQRAADSKYPNQWCIPGGKIEKNETPEQCAIRELREETGIDAPALKYRLTNLGEIDSDREDLKFSVWHLDVPVRPHVVIERGFQGHGWFTLVEVMALGAMEPAHLVGGLIHITEE